MPELASRETKQAKPTPAQRNSNASLMQNRMSNLGGVPLPDGLRERLESKSGESLSDVRIHYNSGKPAQLKALAYTQGSDIHIAPGQETHLPHEGWHAVQQKQGRVSAGTRIGGEPVNLDENLEREADTWETTGSAAWVSARGAGTGVAQRKVITDDINYFQDDGLSNVTLDVKVEHGNTFVNWPVKYVENNYRYKIKKYKTDINPDVGNRNSAMEKIQNKMITIGGIASGDKMTTHLKDESLNDTINPDNLYTKNPNDYLPFMVSISAKDQVNAAKEMKLDVIYANKFYGYISKINDSFGAGGAKEYAMTDANPPAPEIATNTAGIHPNKKYSNIHKVDANRNIKAQADALNDSDDADDFTKVVAEGARWQAVNALAAAGGLRDNSKFYTITGVPNAPNPFPVHYIDFAGLWKSWWHFEKKWNINDATIKNMFSAQFPPDKNDFRQKGQAMPVVEVISNKNYMLPHTGNETEINIKLDAANIGHGGVGGGPVQAPLQWTAPLDAYVE